VTNFFRYQASEHQHNHNSSRRNLPSCQLCW